MVKRFCCLELWGHPSLAADVLSGLASGIPWNAHSLQVNREFSSFFSTFRGHSCTCSPFTGVRHRLSSELSPGEGRHSEWCFCFLLLKKQIKENLHPPKGTQTCGCLPALGAAPCILVWIAQHPWGWQLQPCPHTVPRLLLEQGTTQHKEFPQAASLSCEMIPGHLR